MADPADDDATGREDASEAKKQSSELDSGELFLRLKTWFLSDQDKRRDWEKEAKEDFAFYSGDQWTEEDKAKLRKEMRPLITFNRTQMVLDSVSGNEINNRQEVRFLPRIPGPQSTDDEAAEIITEAGKYFRNEAAAEDEESDAFMDAAICGVGVTETRMEFDENPDGEYVKEKIDPLEMYWDGSSKKANMADSRRFWRAKDLSLAEAMDMFPDAERKALDAAWARGEDTKDKVNKANFPHYRDGDTKNDADLERVTIVHCQWKETAEFWRFSDGMGNNFDFDDDELDEAKADPRVGPMLTMMTPKRVTKAVWRQAWLGSELLGEPDYTLCKKPTWHFITGKRDRNKNQWFGIVRSMKDPQRWANKWLSQSLHILNSQAKGGIIAEQTAFADIKQAKETYAKADAITIAAPGAVSANKIMPKPAAQMPAGFMDLMNFAVSSVRDVSGINLEMLGMADREQPGILEYARKQSAMTILAPLFDSLRRYRKREGGLMLDIIVKYMSDGRLIRVVGDEGARYVPLLKQPGLTKYDIIVDQSPSAPNEKERTWAVLEAMFPVVAPMMNAQMWADILPYSPLPSSLVEKVTKTIADAGANPPPDPEQIKAQLAAQQLQMKSQLDQQNAQTQAALAQQAAEHAQQLEFAKMQKQSEIERMQAEADIATEMRKAEIKAQLDAMKAQQDMAIAELKARHEREKHEMEMHRKSVEFATQQEMQAKQAETDSAKAQGQNDNNSQLAAALKALADAHSRPKKARKGPDGSWMVELG